jgi:bifunctional non-homologous end joining protein LigD
VHKGDRVTGLPLVERKALLQQLLAGVPKQCVLFVADLPAEAALFNQAVMPLQLEGFVAKRRASTYQPGTRSYDWRKIKRPGAVPAERFKR